MKLAKGRLLFIGLSAVALLGLIFAPNIARIINGPDFGYCGDGPRVEYHVAPDAQGIVLTHENTNGALLSDKIRSMEVIPQGIFVGYAGEGGLTDNLSFVSGDTIETCRVGDQHYTGHMNAILYTNGVLYAGTDGNGVYIYHNQVLTHFTHENSGLIDNRIYDVVLRNDGMIVATTYQGLAIYNPVTNEWSNGGHNDAHIHAYAVAGTIEVLGTISNGLISYSETLETTWHSQNVELPGDDVYIEEMQSDNIRVLRLRGSEMWIGADTGLALEITGGRGGRWFNVTPSDTPANFDVLDLEFDGQGRTWATGSQGTWFLTKVLFGKYEDHLYLDGDTLTLEIGTGEFDGFVIIGTNGSGLFFGPLPQ